MYDSIYPQVRRSVAFLGEFGPASRDSSLYFLSSFRLNFDIQLSACIEDRTWLQPDAQAFKTALPSSVASTLSAPLQDSTYVLL